MRNEVLEKTIKLQVYALLEIRNFPSTTYPGVFEETIRRRTGSTFTHTINLGREILTQF